MGKHNLPEASETSLGKSSEGSALQQPPHVHTRQCWDDPGPGHGSPFKICGKLDAKELAEFQPFRNPKIKARVRLENGRLISKANLSRLVVRGTKDISKNILGLGISPEYRELWIVMLEPEGYIWREVTHAMGINGHHRTLRGLVRATACLGYEIEVLPEPMAEEVFASVKERVERRRAQ